MNQAQTEAIANANAHTNDAGLPTYSELVEALRRLNTATVTFATLGGEWAEVAAAEALLDRIPA
ncbi:MAG: hypothetical protein EKK53_26660 [Burkholderiales bacterium]|nr:MAG: hypothetical protein EKK53_26660 [Burkholderiales bacterium]